MVCTRVFEDCYDTILIQKRLAFKSLQISFPSMEQSNDRKSVVCVMQPCYSNLFIYPHIRINSSNLHVGR